MSQARNSAEGADERGDERDEPGTDEAPNEPSRGSRGGAARGAKAARKRSPLKSARLWLRALHRDVGYLLVGLTFVYALSGLAVNHIADWDPNFIRFEATYRLSEPLPANDDEATALVLATIGETRRPSEVFRTEDSLELLLPDREVFVDVLEGTILDRGQRARPVLRVSNWLHLNRGKQSWTYVADAYAILLLFLATSGMFMLPGRNGLRGRGALLVGIGVAIPVVYVLASGGPNGATPNPTDPNPTEADPPAADAMPAADVGADNAPP